MNFISFAIEKVDKALKNYESMVYNTYKDTLEFLSKEGDVSFIRIIGYTPSFNDGEPCEHLVNYEIDVYNCFLKEIGCCYLEDILYYFGITGDEVNEIEYFFKNKPKNKEDFEGINSKYGINFGPPENKTDVQRFVDLVAVPYFNKKFKTNYMVTLIFKNGGVEEQIEEYDCGY